MFRRPITIVLVILVVAVAAFMASTTGLAPAPSDNGRPTVAATIFPVYDITRNIAGDAVNVRLLLPPGASPHTFDPSPSTLSAIADADVLYAIGHGLDGWADGLASSEGVRIMPLDVGIALRLPDTAINAPVQIGEDDHGDDDDHDGDYEEGADPHYWLSVENARLMARNVAADLSARYPDQASVFTENLLKYERELDGLRMEMDEILSALPTRALVTMHDAWYYFAEENGLTIAATVTVSPGKEFTPQQLAALGGAIKDAGITIIYSEPQLSTASIAPFMQDLGLRSAILDPLGGTNDNVSYIQLMRTNARIIAANQR